MIKKETHSNEWVSFWWSWWVSNPRPNKVLKNFLHVYLILIFEISLVNSIQFLSLSSNFSFVHRSIKQIILMLMMPQD